MAITQDGTQKFGISTATFATDAFIVESFTSTEPGDSVELRDGDGLDIGRTTIPRAKTFSATVQFGAAANTTPTVGSEISYGGDTLIVQSADVAETQADYVRINLSGYVKIN